MGKTSFVRHPHPKPPFGQDCSPILRTLLPPRAGGQPLCSFGQFLAPPGGQFSSSNGVFIWPQRVLRSSWAARVAFHMTDTWKSPLTN